MSGTHRGDPQIFSARPDLNIVDTPWLIPCEGEVLVGIAHLPETPLARGVLIVVGGPQYRVGSHRQFVSLARALATVGTAVLRFDYRGMGDSTGSPRDFENIQDDIRCATNYFFNQVPSLKELVIWGLCDAASAALFYAHGDPRVTGLVLLNPWVRTEQTKARAYITHYYHKRVFSVDLWRQFLQGKVNVFTATKSLGRQFFTAFQNGAPTSAQETVALPLRMAESFSRFQGQTLIILSGNDLTAQEFTAVCHADASWQKLINSSKVTRKNLPYANHTFSTKAWRDQIAEWTKDWLRAW